MTHETSEKRRNAWMGHEGRNIYTEWMERLIEASDFHQPLFNLDVVRSSEAVRTDGRVAEIRAFADSMKTLYKDADDYLFGAGTEPLEEHFDEISAYTSLADFTGPYEDGVASSALHKHNTDSLGFAIDVTLGFAHLAEKQMARNGQKDMPATGYESFAARLRNPQFHETLEALSFTGFGVHGDRVPSMTMASDAEQRLSGYYDLQTGDLLAISVDEAGNESISLGEPLTTCLKDELKRQNSDGVSRIKATSVWDFSPITSGCPVRRPVPGAQKSAIAMFSEALASQVERHMVSSQTTRSLGRASTVAY